MGVPIVFSLAHDDLALRLSVLVGGKIGGLQWRSFPDEETYIQVQSPVAGQHCIVVADFSRPNEKFLALLFLLDTLRDLGAKSVGLVLPYLCYMRQDCRFNEGEAISSAIFARTLSAHIDWLVTLDPHLHRYKTLDEIYSVPCRVIPSAPVLADWLKNQNNLLLLGPDEESEQWLSKLSELSGQPFAIGAKRRLGDRQVEVSLPDLSAFTGASVVIVDDVIASGHTVLQAIEAIQRQGFSDIQCVAVHGVFSDDCDHLLIEAGVRTLVTTNTVVHASNVIDISPLLKEAILEFITTT